MQPSQMTSQPTQPMPQPAQVPSTPQMDSLPLRDQARIQRRSERHVHNQEAGIPVWGVLLILIGIIALLDTTGIGGGWLFGLALGAWLVYLGVRHVPEGQPVNWWLVGFGLLVGLGSVTSGFALVDKLVFPAVLVLVGLGILGEHLLTRQNQGPSQS